MSENQNQEPRHRPLVITGKVRPMKSKPYTHLRIKNLGCKDKDWVVNMIEKGYEFIIKRGNGPATFVIVKDVLGDNGKMSKYLVTIGDESDINNIHELLDVQLDEVGTPELQNQLY